MNKKRWLSIGGLLLAIAAGSLAISADKKTTRSAESNIFDGKIVVVITDRSNALENRESSEILKEPEIRKIGGKVFIVGATHLSSDAAADWRRGAEVGIEWNSVRGFYAYSPKQFEEVDKLWSEAEE
jgi:hypothetical protein